MSKNYFTTAEFESRQQKVREAMEQAGIELLLVIAPVHINYLIGATAKGYQEFQVLFFPLEPGPLMIQSRLPELPMLVADSLADEVRGWGGREPEDPIEVFEEILRAKGYRGLRTGLEVPNYYLHPHHHNQLVDLLGDDLVMDATDLIGNIKLVKSPAEIEYVRKAGAILDRGMETCISQVEAGKTERAISADIHHTLLAAGSDIQASPMNFLTGPRSAFAHGEPSDRRLEPGDFMHIQFGAHYRRYCVTIGRQLCLGEPTRRMRDVYQTVRDAGDACIAEMRAGVPAAVPHEFAKKVIADAGLDAYRLHMTGYAVGAAFPPSWIEPLIMDAGCDYTLEAGMVIAVEPPVFGLEEGLGVRLIDNVLITETGCERLTETTRDLIIV
ncbi:MAG: Xaa-Pro peptidase family protein [Gammaproteobacteria bacterium]|nr:Xaa-Pro peptidase family protein [Gammaproteobacteria bacterium]